MIRFNVIDWVAMVLGTIGALNWGLVGAFNFNLVTALFGAVPALVTAVYVIVGLAGLWMVYMLVRAPAGVPATAA